MTIEELLFSNKSKGDSHSDLAKMLLECAIILGTSVPKVKIDNPSETVPIRDWRNQLETRLLDYLNAQGINTSRPFIRRIDYDILSNKVQELESQVQSLSREKDLLQAVLDSRNEEIEMDNNNQERLLAIITDLDQHPIRTCVKSLFSSL